METTPGPLPAWDESPGAEGTRGFSIFPLSVSKMSRVRAAVPSTTSSWECLFLVQLLDRRDGTTSELHPTHQTQTIFLTKLPSTSLLLSSSLVPSDTKFLSQS